MEIENVTKVLGAVTASFAVLVGGYNVADKLGLWKRDILRWEPSLFSISDGPADGEFKVNVAREKLRDDCMATDFMLDIRASDYIVHHAAPSITTFMGPANHRVETFAYTFTIPHPDRVAAGEATLIAHIHYECPEGNVIVQYPDHPNLRFNITQR